MYHETVLYRETFSFPAMKSVVMYISCLIVTNNNEQIDILMRWKWCIVCDQLVHWKLFIACYLLNLKLRYKYICSCIRLDYAWFDHLQFAFREYFPFNCYHNPNLDSSKSIRRLVTSASWGNFQDDWNYIS